MRMCMHIIIAQGSALGRSVAAVGWISLEGGSMRPCVTLLLSAAAGQRSMTFWKVCVYASESGNAVELAWPGLCLARELGGKTHVAGVSV